MATLFHTMVVVGTIALVATLIIAAIDAIGHRQTQAPPAPPPLAPPVRPPATPPLGTRIRTVGPGRPPSGIRTVRVEPERPRPAPTGPITTARRVAGVPADAECGWCNRAAPQVQADGAGPLARCMSPGCFGLNCQACLRSHHRCSGPCGAAPRSAA